MNRDPDTYVITSASFGDRPAGAIATLALRKTAELGKDDYPTAAATIINNSYVDDIVDSVPSHADANRITKEIDQLLKPGGFEIKEWVVSKIDNEENKEHRHNAEKLEENLLIKSGPQKVLGMCWDAATDSFQFSVRLNLSPKRRKLRIGPDLSQEQIPREIPVILTKRMVLSQVNGIYDPMGLATPFTVKAKILMRKLWCGSNKALGWDDPMPEELRNEWIEFFREMFKMKDIAFPRCIKPSNAVGDPSIIFFSDGSEEAYGTCAYARWELSNGKFDSNLIASKGRVAPLKKISIVRLELNGALLSKRLKGFVMSLCQQHDFTL